MGHQKNCRNSIDLVSSPVLPFLEEAHYVEVLMMYSALAFLFQFLWQDSTLDLLHSSRAPVELWVFRVLNSECILPGVSSGEKGGGCRMLPSWF